MCDITIEGSVESSRKKLGLEVVAVKVVIWKSIQKN